MSDEEDDYEYEYDEDEDNMEEENQFQYTDEEDEQDDGVVALENAYYNAKGLRDTSVSEATAALEQVIAQEQEQLQKEGKKYGIWSYKAMKQLVKLHLRVGSSANGVLDQETIMKYYRRLLECISSNGSDISPAAVEKGINTMLERVASVNYNVRSPEDGTNSSRTLALAVYDATLTVFHPKTGPYKIERLWFKTNLKYGQLLYEMNETTKLQLVLKELIQVHGEPDEIVHSNNNASSSSSSGGASASTNSMEIYALQIQLYSRQKDNRKLRETFHKAMNVRGGIPHPRTIALIQELGGKMYMSHNEYEEASKTFFQAFKSYDEAGDPSRLRCLKYLVLASMLHASSINPFDSQEARPYRDDPEIVVMTNLVKAFHNNEIQTFERILRQNQGRVMDDEFIRAYVEDLLRAIRTQVLRRFIRPYERITLSAMATALNDIPLQEVENLLVQMILDGNLDGYMDGTSRVLYKRVEYGGGDSSAAGKAASNAVSNTASMTVNQADARHFAGRNLDKSQTVLQLEAMNEIIGILDDVSRQNISMQKS